MSEFSDYLKKIKNEYNIESSEALYNLLCKNELRNISFEEFSEVEIGKTKPSVQIVESLLKTLDKKDQQVLINEYCKTVFSAHSISFDNNITRFSKQKASLELNEYQINELSKTKIHYFLFLILLLKEEKIKRSILKKQFGDTDSIDAAIEDLIRQQILIENNQFIYSMSFDVKFPKANSEKIKKAYSQFDEWDRGFAKAFQYENLIEKTLIKKVSEKHVSIIQKQIESTLELIRTSEVEDKDSRSMPVLFLQVSFAKGK